MPKIILLDSIRSMQNVGAIFRNADGAGFEKIILTGYTPYPIRSDISKTALGAQSFVDREYYENVLEILKKLKKSGYKIYSIEINSKSIDYKELFKEKEKKICLVAGNEVSGIREEILDLSDKIVSIPMSGKKESLNVSVATGIVMYSLNKG